MVGGGAILAPDDLEGVSKVHRFQHYACANAVGAAIAQISGTVDSVEDIGERSIKDVQKGLEQRAREIAIAKGAAQTTVDIIESEAIPIAYTAGKCRFVVKAAGEWTTSPVVKRKAVALEALPPQLVPNQRKHFEQKDADWTPQGIKDYRPNVCGDSWWLSEIDLAWIRTGSYILGCGGGGDPEHTFLAARELLRNGQDIKVVSLQSLRSNTLIAWGGGMGSPEVCSERLMSDELVMIVARLIHLDISRQRECYMTL